MKRRIAKTFYQKKTRQSKIADFLRGHTVFHDNNNSNSTWLASTVRCLFVITVYTSGDLCRLRFNYIAISVMYAPLCETMTSPTKPEVHNVLHWRKRRPSHGCIDNTTENFVEFGTSDMRFLRHARTDRQTNKQTNRHAHRNTSHSFQVRIKNHKALVELRQRQRLKVHYQRNDFTGFELTNWFVPRLW